MEENNQSENIHNEENNPDTQTNQPLQKKLPAVRKPAARKPILKTETSESAIPEAITTDTPTATESLSNNESEELSATDSDTKKLDKKNLKKLKKMSDKIKEKEKKAKEKQKEKEKKAKKKKKEKAKKEKVTKKLKEKKAKKKAADKKKKGKSKKK